MCTVGLLVSYLCILEVFVSTFELLLYRKFTFAYLLHLWNEKSEQHQSYCLSKKNVSPLGNVLILEKNKCQKCPKMLMQFWCSFDAVLIQF